MKFSIASPVGTGVVHHLALRSVVDIQEWLLDSGHEVDFTVLAHSDVVTARNVLATRFLESDADVMLGIDDDVAATIKALSAMLSVNLDYVAACLPRRQMSFEMFAEGVRKGFPARYARRYAAPLMAGPGAPEGIAPIDEVPTGFFVLRRAALERIVQTGLVVTREVELPQGVERSLGFYDIIYHRGDAHRLSEDFSFCARVYDSGGVVHAYKGPGICHAGETTFRS